MQEQKGALYSGTATKTMGSILVTGGAGFIGSHCCVELLESGYEVIIMDNLFNSKEESVNRIQQITGKPVTFYRTDMLDLPGMEQIFSAHHIDAVIHFAGLKAVGESVAKPLEYYHNNLTGTLLLLQAMGKYGCKKLVFSSSATVYGVHNPVPYTEDMPTSATNPYGYTKVMIEQFLRDLVTADPEWSVVALRYFNPIGAHPSGLIGEDPNGIPNNLVPYIAKVASGQLKELHVFGNDWPTHDGTGVRDYIHIVDLARGHVAALRKLEENCGLFLCNLGTGKGYSVLDVLHAYEKACGKKLPYVIDPRRPGDIAECWADPTKAQEELGWEAQYGIEEMCASSWNWQKKNPNGYRS